MCRSHTHTLSLLSVSLALVIAHFSLNHLSQQQRVNNAALIQMKARMARSRVIRARLQIGRACERLVNKLCHWQWTAYITSVRVRTRPREKRWEEGFYASSAQWSWLFGAIGSLLVGFVPCRRLWVNHEWLVVARIVFCRVWIIGNIASVVIVKNPEVNYRYWVIKLLTTIFSNTPEFRYSAQLYRHSNKYSPVIKVPAPGESPCYCFPPITRTDKYKLGRGGAKLRATCNLLSDSVNRGIKCSRKKFNNRRWFKFGYTYIRDSGLARISLRNFEICGVW